MNEEANRPQFLAHLRDCGDYFRGMADVRDAAHRSLARSRNLAG